MKSEALRGNRTNKLALLAWLFAGALASCLAAPAIAFAGPALEVEQSFSQPDGTSFRANLRGDEYFNYVQTADGYLVQKNASDQVWSYVVDAGAGYALGPRADEGAPTNALTPSALASEADKTAYAALGGSTYSAAVHDTGDVVTLADIEAAQGSTNADAYGLRTATQTETSLPLITIVIGFDTGAPDGTAIEANYGTWTAVDQRYRDDFDWNKQLYGGEYSITNFYATMSNGKFSWVPAAAEKSACGTGDNTNTSDRVGDGIIHVTLNRNHGNWKSPALGSPEAADMRGAYAEALEKASTYIDFSAYDTNKNGMLEKTEACILFVVAGYEASAGANAPATWAFQWSLDSMDMTDLNPVTVDGIAFTSFITMGETLRVEEAGIEAQPMSVGTASHELGHYLGLPDLYDTYNVSYDPDSANDEYPWIEYDAFAASLMASGSWCMWVGDDGKTIFAPSSFDAFCLEELGYIEPTTVAADGTYEVSTYWSDGGYACLKIPTDVDGEYYLVENRQFESFDKGLTQYYRDQYSDEPTVHNKTGGIVVWHVDRSIVDTRGIAVPDPDLANTINTVDHRPGVMPVYLELSSYSDGLPLLLRPFYNADTFATFNLNALSPLLYDGCATPDERVASGISLTMDEDASNVMNVTVDLPEAHVASLTAEAPSMGWEGGANRITAAGRHLRDGIELRVYDRSGARIADEWATATSDPSDDASARTASITFPENGTGAAISYTVRAAYAGIESEAAATVTVGGRYVQHVLTANAGGTSIEVAGAFSDEGREVSLALAALTDEQVAHLATASDRAGVLIAGADVTVADTTGRSVAHTGKLSVTFSVDARYDGQDVLFVHEKADGTFETAQTTVRNGRATMAVDELSPFALFEVKAADANPAAATPVAKPLARTGDHVGGRVAASLALCAGLALAGARISRRAASRCRR